jgi:hypothetical protein
MPRVTTSSGLSTLTVGFGKQLNTGLLGVNANLIILCERDRPCSTVQ